MTAPEPHDLQMAGAELRLRAAEMSVRARHTSEPSESRAWAQTAAILTNVAEWLERQAYNKVNEKDL